MDNRDFNVTGRSKQQLLQTIKCLLLNEYGDFRKVQAWKFVKQKGLILYWSDSVKDSHKMMGNLNPEQITDAVWQWLQTEEAKTTTLSGNDVDCKHDGHNKIGFRVYNEGWSEVEGHDYSICAVTPRHCWYGK
ncbi:hypothetical protein [Flagellimonas sp.]|uniref:hypothetical protein n=1 Tax=Flagellimonas sp. TaxID=2058762 RepID=UPI003F4A0FA9